MQKEPRSLFITKNVMRVSLIVGIVLVFGIMGYLAINKNNLSDLSDGKTAENNNSNIDETADWKVYKNEEYGFEVRYPENYSLEQGVYTSDEKYRKSWVQLTNPEWSDQKVNNPSLIIDLIETELSLEEYIKEMGDKGSIMDETCSKEAIYCSLKEKGDIYIGDGNILGLQFSSAAASGSDEHILVKNKGYIIDLRKHNSGMGEFSDDIYRKILSTFKFIEDNKDFACSREGDLFVLGNSAYPYNKARIISKEGKMGGSVDFPNYTFAINDSNFVLEGVNISEVNRIDVEWKGDGRIEPVGNFARGDTHWCFNISEEKGNLKKGTNIYFVRLYLDNEEKIEYSVQLIWGAFAGEIEDKEVLHINWLDKIQKEPITKFFSQEQLDNFYTDCNYYELDYKTPKPCYELFSFYRAGTVDGGKYDDYEYCLVSQTFIGDGESDYYYRILFNSKDKRLILLKEYSNDLSSQDKIFFTLANHLTIDNLLPKAEIPIPGTGYYLEPHSDSPNALFSDVVATGFYSISPKKLFTDPDAGDIYLEEHKRTFIVRVSDGSIMVYRMKLPFIKTMQAAEDWNTDDLLLDIRFEDGRQNTEYYSHGSRYQFVCAGGKLYDIVSGDFLDVNTQLKLAGTSSSGDKFYEINNEEKLKEIYNNKRTIPIGISDESSYIFHQDITFEEFKALHPLLFWRDPFGRWIQFTDNIFSSDAECGGGYGKSAL